MLDHLVFVAVVVVDVIVVFTELMCSIGRSRTRRSHRTTGRSRRRLRRHWSRICRHNRELYWFVILLQNGFTYEIMF